MMALNTKQKRMAKDVLMYLAIGLLGFAFVAYGAWRMSWSIMVTHHLSTVAIGLMAIYVSVAGFLKTMKRRQTNRNDKP